MAVFNYDHLNIHYERFGNGKTLLFLHGWGTSGDSFAPLYDALKSQFEIVYLDFPGFGQSDEPQRPYDLSDYTAMTKAFIEALNLKDPVLIGHSFGGRVSVKIASDTPISNIVLINSAGIKPKRSTAYYFKVYGYKLLKNFAKLPIFSWILNEPLKAYSEIYSSDDYKRATPMMKQILSKVVNEDLTPLLPQIKASSLLIWGDLDTSTPLEDAKTMADLIPDSGLVVYENTGHFAYLEHSEKTALVIKTFLGGNAS